MKMKKIRAHIHLSVLSQRDKAPCDTGCGGVGGGRPRASEFFHKKLRIWQITVL